MNRITKIFWRKGRKDDARGIVATEFALMLPILVTLLLGCADAAYSMIINQRLDRVSYTVTDLVTQSEKVTIADLNTILGAAEQVMLPFTFNTVGNIIVSSVYREAGKTTKIMWQHTGGGELVRTSRIGLTGGTPTLPYELTLNENDNVIVVEVFYVFKPIFADLALFSSGDLYKVAVYKPRLSLLIETPK